MENIKLKKYTKKISQSLVDINRLIEVPNLIKEITLNNLKSFDLFSLENTKKPKFNNLIKSIENISDESIKDAYKIIYNQVCILAVSALSATLEEYFINFVTAHQNKMDFSKEDIKINLNDLSKYDFNIKPFLGSILLEKINSINFQDLQKTKISFEKYCKKKIILNKEIESRIIFYQQCRHVLVHKNGYIDNDFLKKVRDNNIKKYQIGDKIELDKSDWESIKTNFFELVNIVTVQKSEYDLTIQNKHEN